MLKTGLRGRNDEELALDPLMKNRAQLSENIRKWERGGGGGALTNLVEKRGYHGTDKKPEGLSSKGEISILIWSLIFSSHPGHFCLFISKIHKLLGEKKGILMVCTRKNDQRVHDISVLRGKMWEQGVVLPLTMPQYAVNMCMSVSEGAGKGRAAFLSLEPGYPLLCPRSMMRCPCICSFGKHMSSDPGDLR